MNNLTMNLFQSIGDLSLFWITSCHFCHSEHFVDNKKDRSHLVQDLVNMVDWVEQTSLNPMFFLHDSCRNNVSDIDEWGAS